MGQFSIESIFSLARLAEVLAEALEQAGGEGLSIKELVERGRLAFAKLLYYHLFRGGEARATLSLIEPRRARNEDS
jgi:hypothetical protein